MTRFLACFALLAAALLSVWGLAGCASLERMAGFKGAAPLSGVAAIQAAPSVPLRRPAAGRGARSPSDPLPDVNVWLYVSLASQARLVELGADPTSAMRIWEFYFAAAKLPYARISAPADLARIAPHGVLILPSVLVLSEAEKAAIRASRERGGSVLATWRTGMYGAAGEQLDPSFMRDDLDTQVAGDTSSEPDDVFMMVHGDSPLSHGLAAGTRVWLERVPNQLPLRLVGAHASAHIMDWSRDVDAAKPSGLIVFNERRMPSGRHSRVVVIGYPEQNWQRSDPKQLKSITGDILAWLLRRPQAYLGAWPHPYRSGLLFAMQAAEQVSEPDVAIGKAVADMGGRMTCYVHADNAAKAAPYIAQLQKQGHEIGYLGDSFTEFKGQSAERQAERLQTMHRRIAEAGLGLRMPAAFAPPMDAYDDTTLRLLNQGQYDSYLTFMEVTEARLPFFAGNAARTVVLPRSLSGPEDALEEVADSGLDNFVAALNQSAGMGGLSIVRLPAQTLLVAEQRERILAAMRALRHSAWIASAHQIAKWWRERANVSVKLENRPEGHVLSAHVARALTGQQALSIWVNLPEPSARLRIEALDKSAAPLPTVTAVDALRAALVWRAPAEGTYRWRLVFDTPGNDS